MDGETTLQVGANEQASQAQSAANQTAGTPPVAPAQTPAAGSQETDSQKKIEDLPEWARALVSDLRKENAGHRTKAKDAEKTAQEAEEKRLADEKRWQELAEKRQAELEKASQELARVQREVLVRDVATAACLPAALAARLRGTTREELEADAAELKELIPTAPTQTPGAPAGPNRAGGAGELDDARKAELQQRFRINS
ncbi:MAG: hypothetical protein JXR84_04210 [Anaerolineae bacterium]|nr:hypothetical protein [Anaerolineae bacterium]